MVLFLLFLGVFNCFAQTNSIGLNTNAVIHAIVMEASAEPFLAQQGIAEVIRRRGSLQGIYGASAHRHEGKAAYNKATKAWIASATSNITQGCKYFGGTIDDDYFANVLHKKPFLTIGHTRFYK